LIYKYSEDQEHADLYNYACQVFNHNFHFSNLIPHGIPASLWMEQQLTVHFGSVLQFQRVLAMNAGAIYGSGWTWIIDNDSNLEVVNGYNAGNPLGKQKVTLLLGIDLWEHAYFTDFRVNRLEFLHNWLQTINWGIVERKLKNLHFDDGLDKIQFNKFRNRVNFETKINTNKEREHLLSEDEDSFDLEKILMRKLKNEKQQKKIRD